MRFKEACGLCIVLFLVLLSSDVTAVTASSGNVEIPIRSLNPRDETEDGLLNCETARSSDYYGLGVRIGIYFAWFQAWIANAAVPSEMGAALDTNAVFLFAILVSMVRCTLTKILLQMDGLMLMHMAGGTIFSVLSLWGYRTCTYDVSGPVEGIRRFGGWGTHFRLLLSMAISTFGLFYWAWGIRGALDWNTDPGCGVVYTFMFAKVRADGGIRTFYIIVCAGCMIYFGLMLLVSLVAIPEKLKRWYKAHEDGDSGERTRLKFATGLDQKQLRYVFYFLRIGNLLFIIYSMLLIEFSLNYNNVNGVLGWRGHIFFPSQCIPMIIGAFGFCRVVWVRYIQWKSPDYLHSKTTRTILKPIESEFIKIYTPKSNASGEFIQARRRKDHDMDPLMKDQPIWLRLLVSWLPWLGVLHWWAPDYVEGDHAQSTSAKLSTSPDFGRWSPDFNANNKIETSIHRDTWRSDDTITARHQKAPRIPRDTFKFSDTI